MIIILLKELIFIYFLQSHFVEVGKDLEEIGRSISDIKVCVQKEHNNIKSMLSIGK